MAIELTDQQREAVSTVSGLSTDAVDEIVAALNVITNISDTAGTVRVDHDPGDTAVYIDRGDGKYVVVYVGSIYAYKGGYVIDEDISFSLGEIAWEPPK